MIFTISSEMVSSTLAYVGYVFSDLKPFVFLILGLYFGFIIIKTLFNTFFAIRGYNKFSKNLEDLEDYDYFKDVEPEDYDEV